MDMATLPFSVLAQNAATKAMASQQMPVSHDFSRFALNAPAPTLHSIQSRREPPFDRELHA
jgi:hypothetical protein